MSLWFPFTGAVTVSQAGLPALSPDMNINLSAASWLDVCWQNTHALFINIFGVSVVAVFSTSLPASCSNLLNLVESVAVSVSTYTPWPLSQTPSATTGSLIKRLLSVRNTNSSGTNKHATFTYISCLPHSDAGFELQHTYIP